MGGFHTRTCPGTSQAELLLPVALQYLAWLTVTWQVSVGAAVPGLADCDLASVSGRCSSLPGLAYCDLASVSGRCSTWLG